jgi:hypothetical protein
VVGIRRRDRLQTVYLGLVAITLLSGMLEAIVATAGVA